MELQLRPVIANALRLRKVFYSARFVESDHFFSADSNNQSSSEMC